MAARRVDVAFLWLGEMLLIPHLWPIVAALARLRPDLKIDLWISTSVHEALIRSWLAPDLSNIRLRRVPGFKVHGPTALGENVEVPDKLAMLVRLAPYLMNVKVAVCAEQTSLWLARSKLLRTRFIFTVHGTGPLNHGRGQRLRSAWRLLIPSEGDKAMHAAAGIDPARMIVTGYVKAATSPILKRADLFADDRPIIVYTPHWQAYRSSWWQWGRQAVAMLAEQQDFNVILAPHQRLIERDPEAKAVLEAAARPGHVHVDTGSFAMVDGSYTAMADIYLGDTSSQLLEYLARPRPCIFLSPPGMSWRDMDKGAYDRCGAVVTDFADLAPALQRALPDHEDYRDFQRDFAATVLGDTSGAAPVRAAEAIVAALA